VLGGGNALNYVGATLVTGFSAAINVIVVAAGLAKVLRNPAFSCSQQSEASTPSQPWIGGSLHTSMNALEQQGATPSRGGDKARQSWSTSTKI
jgi:hypothetical protein